MDAGCMVSAAVVTFAAAVVNCAAPNVPVNVLPARVIGPVAVIVPSPADTTLYPNAVVVREYDADLSLTKGTDNGAPAITL